MGRSDVVGRTREGADMDDGMDGLDDARGNGTFEKRGISTATTTGSALLCDTDDVEEAGVRPATTWRSLGTMAPKNTCNQ